MSTRQKMVRICRQMIVWIVFGTMIFALFQIFDLRQVSSREKKVVTIWHPHPVEFPEAWAAKLHYFKINNPDIDLRMEAIPFKGYVDKLVVAGKAGKLPSVFSPPGVLRIDVGSMGLAIPLDSFIEKEGRAAYLADFPEGTVYPYKGKLYALPENIGAAGLYYNIEMFKQAGIASPPQTWEELVDITTKLTDPVKSVWGLSGDGVTWEGMREWASFLFQADGRLVDEEGKCALNTPEGREAFQFMVDLINKYKVVPNWSGTDMKMARLNFINGRTAMLQNAHFVRAYINEVNPDLKYGTAVQPRHKTTGSVIYGSYLSISTNCKDKDLGWWVLKSLINTESDLLYALLNAQLPVRRSNLKRAYFANHPHLSTFAKAMLLPNALDGFPCPHIRTRYEILLKGMQEVVFGQKTTQQALADIEKEWNAVGE